MIATTVQRWRGGRASYRPAGEPIRTSAYEVSEITTDSEARAFVETHHYERSYPAARLRVGLYRGAELGRFVLLDDVPANGESWFLARAFELARSRFDAVVSHSDPFPRRGQNGDVTFPGHIGTIYQATNAVYVGVTPRRTRRQFADGTICSARALTKLRLRERGWKAAAEMLIEHGAPTPAGEWRAWVRSAVEATTTAVRHPGNHRYLWALDRSLRRQLPSGIAYPKQ